MKVDYRKRDRRWVLPPGKMLSRTEWGGGHETKTLYDLPKENRNQFKYVKMFASE